ncbi:MAG TPA: patatin-like phospholipase family protein [Gaiellaceae bacterium]|jgi:predicted acylesterase/phospholipase RssA|nr:patatin-like phospholipase family protein [Gaiellaceae bacterium]
MKPRRDVGVVLSGGGVNGVMMELGFLQRLRESVLWPRVAAIFGTSSGALSGSLAALDRLDDLERFLMALQPEQTFRPNRLWRLPFLGLHDYALPQTIDIWFGGMTRVVEDLATAPIELVVVATDLTDAAITDTGFELVYSSRTTPPAELAQAILASAAVSALVMPVRVGDRIATDGAWVRNFPLAHAYSHKEVELIVGFRYFARYPRLGVEALQPLRTRLMRFRKIPPVRAFIAEIDEAEARAERGEPAHLADMIVRLARVTIRRNTLSEERVAEATDQSLRELRSLRHDVLGLVDDPGLREAVAARFVAARFPFGQNRIVPRIIVHGTTNSPGLEPGVRNQPRWSEEDKRRLIRRGWELADKELNRRLH